MVVSESGRSLEGDGNFFVAKRHITSAKKQNIGEIVKILGDRLIGRSFTIGSAGRIDRNHGRGFLGLIGDIGDFSRSGVGIVSFIPVRLFGVKLHPIRAFLGEIGNSVGIGLGILGPDVSNEDPAARGTEAEEARMPPSRAEFGKVESESLERTSWIMFL